MFLEQRDFVSEKLVASNGESWPVVESWNIMGLSALLVVFLVGKLVSPAALVGNYAN